MPIDFPNTPSLGQIFTEGNRAWQWDGTAWVAYFVSPSTIAYPWPVAQPVQTKVASYTAQNSDAGSLIIFDSGSNLTITIDNTLGLLPGQRIDIIRLGTGTLTVQQGTGATVNGTTSLSLRDRYSAGTILCTSTNTYVLVGDVA